jgi:hypothetical protein
LGGKDGCQFDEFSGVHLGSEKEKWFVGIRPGASCPMDVVPRQCKPSAGSFRTLLTFTEVIGVPPVKDRSAAVVGESC